MRKSNTSMRWRFLLIPIVFAVVVAACSVIEPRPKYLTMYQVQKGDTIQGIASKFHVDPDLIADFNEIGDPRSLPAGMVLQIPTGRQAEMRASYKASDNEDKKSSRKISLNRAKRYLGNLEWPIKGAMLTSKFGSRFSSFHEGLDLSSPTGTPIYAAHSGEVAYAGSGLNGYGKVVILKGDDIVTLYAHASRILVDVGDRIEEGEEIAEVGATGDATGPHLHFEIRIRDENARLVAVDPLAFYRK